MLVLRLKLKAEKLGIEIVREESFNAEENDFRPALLKVRTDKVDAIYAPIDGNVTTFFQQAKQSGIKASLISSDVIGEDYIREAPNAFEGVYQSQSIDPVSAEADKLRASYKKQYNKDLAYPLLTRLGT